MRNVQSISTVLQVPILYFTCPDLHLAPFRNDVRTDRLLCTKDVAKFLGQTDPGKLTAFCLFPL